MKAARMAIQTGFAVLVAALAVSVAVVNGEATGVFLKDAAASDNAVCLDGTPGLYYVQKGSGSGANKWYVHHQGGGWCESLDDCLGRSKGALGSTSKDPPTKSSLGDGYFSTDASVNPMMYNWNMVFMRYCDGGSFSGNNATATEYKGATLHFRGKHILDAIITDLLTNQGLSSATDLVVSGCSAGGLATYLHADHWASRVPRSVKVAALPDSGFFLDEQFISASVADTTTPGNYHDGLVWVFHQMNSTSGVNDACIEAHARSGDTELCIFAEHTAPHIKTPTFPLQSEYDSWQTGHVLPVSTNATMVNQMGANMTARVHANLLSQPQHGIFLDSCHHHCGEWGDITIDGDNQAQAFMAFYNGIGDRHAKKVWIQGQTYPCDACCKPSA